MTSTDPTPLFANDRKPKLDKRPLLEPQELAEQGPPEAVLIPVELIDASPSNPRRALLEIDQLAESIADPNIGLLQPVAVRRMGDRYELISGHRRRAAFLLLQEQQPFEVRWKSIPAVIRTMDDDQSYLALISAQVHNRSWSAREEAAALERLAETRTLRAVGALVHRSENWVGNRLKIYADVVLSPLVQSGRLPAGVAAELLRIVDTETRRDLAERAAAEDWGQDRARSEARRLKLDLQIRLVGRQARELLDVLSAVEPGKLPLETTRDLWVLHGRIEVLAKGDAPVFPTLEAARRAAGVSETPPRSERKRRRRMMPPPS